MKHPILKSSWVIPPPTITFTGQIKMQEVVHLDHISFMRLKPTFDSVLAHVGTPRPPKPVVTIIPHKRGESSVPYDHNGSLPLHKRIR